LPQQRAYLLAGLKAKKHATTGLLHNKIIHLKVDSSAGSLSCSMNIDDFIYKLLFAGSASIIGLWMDLGDLSILPSWSRCGRWDGGSRQHHTLVFDWQSGADF